jgi:protein SCO1
MNIVTVSSRCALVACICLCVLAAARPAWAGGGGPENPLDKVGFDQRLNAQVPLDLPFHDEAGATVRLGDYFGQKPVVMVLAYYQCPNLCTLALTQLVETLRKLAFDVGDQFNVVTVSIDPTETPALATAKKASYLKRYGRPGGAAGWHFLTGEQASIQQLAQAIGFRYAYDAEQHQYAHPTGSIVLTPQGRISRYFYGIEYSSTDMRLGLVEASADKIGSPVDLVLLRCYHYDPQTGKYDLVIMDVVRLAALATVVLVGMFVARHVWRDRQRELRV